MKADSKGQCAQIVIGALVGALVSAAKTIADALVNDEPIDTTEVLISAAVGAVSGAKAATGLPVLYQASITAGVYAAGDIASQVHDARGNDFEIDGYQVLGAAITGFSSSIIGSASGNLAAGKQISVGTQMINDGNDKLLEGYLREAAGKSHSQLIRTGRALVTAGSNMIASGQALNSVVGTLSTIRLNILWGVIQ